MCRQFYMVSNGDVELMDPSCDKMEFDGETSILVYAVSEADAIRLAGMYDCNKIGYDNMCTEYGNFVAINGGCIGVKGSDLTSNQQKEFYDAFYWANDTDLDDSYIDGLSNPWGCPWDNDDPLLYGDNITEMAENYFRDVRQQMIETLQDCCGQ